MRAGVWVSCAVLIAAVAASPGRAGDTSPVIVIPGRPGVPIIINGRDVSGAIIEGDWGLARPGWVNPTVIYPEGPRVIYGPGGGYFPGGGMAPAYGRKEIIPPANRPLPPPAETYHRAWGAQSDPVPASAPSAEVPTVIVAPPFNGEAHRKPRSAPRGR